MSKLDEEMKLRALEKRIARLERVVVALARVLDAGYYKEIRLRKDELAKELAS
jgi:hypothetical protein